jgi:putative ABC transport system permease protein
MNPTLILALDAIFLGVTNQLTRYIDESGADVFVAQRGVHNLHMVASALPPESVARIEAVDGVRATTPLLYVTGTVSADDADAVAYVFGLPQGAAMGLPARLAAGTTEIRRGQAIIDSRAARRLGVGMGDAVAILGRRFSVAGLSDGTSNLVNSIAFIRFEDFTAARLTEPAVSYVLVRVSDGADPRTVAAAIESQVPGTSALSRADFSAEERRLVMDMSGDVIATMNIIGFVVGLVVVALTVYVATLSRRREFGILKALGVSNRFLYVVVIEQAALSVALGLLAGLAFTSLLAFVVPRTGADLELAIGLGSLLRVSALGALIALFAALLPIRQIAGLDPALVFRRGGA